MFLKGLTVAAAFLFCMFLQAPHIFPADAGTSNGSTLDENPINETVTPPLFTEEQLKKLEKCYRNTILICDKDYEQCSQEPDIRHPGLNACLEIKFDCLETCKRDCSICCNRDGTPECSADCRRARGSCEKKCEEDGTRCTMEAMMGKPVKPIDKNCEERLEQCRKVVKDLCVEGL